MKKIYAEIERNFERYLQELFTLIRQPSISSQRIGIEECAKLLAGMMEAAGDGTLLTSRTNSTFDVAEFWQRPKW